MTKKENNVNTSLLISKDICKPQRKKFVFLPRKIYDIKKMSFHCVINIITIIFLSTSLIRIIDQVNNKLAKT